MGSVQVVNGSQVPYFLLNFLKSPGNTVISLDLKMLSLNIVVSVLQHLCPLSCVHCGVITL